MTRLLLLLLAMSGAANASAAGELGRFFFTPAERAQLDQARAQKQRPAAAKEAAREEPPAPQILTYSGVVRRSDGKSVLWINNRSADEKDALAGLPVTGRVRQDGTVTLQLPQSGRSVDLKVGQSVELGTGSIAERRPSTTPTAPPAKPAQEPPPTPAKPEANTTPPAAAPAASGERTGSP